MELNWKKVEMNENKLHNNCTLKIFRYPYVRHTVNSCIAAECDYGTCMYATCNYTMQRTSAN